MCALTQAMYARGYTCIDALYTHDMRRTLYRGFARRGTPLYAHDFALPSGFLFVLRGIEKNNKTPFYFWIPSWQKLKFQPSVCTIILATLCNFGIVVWTHLKVSRHFLVFSYTAPCEEETNMAVESAMTCKIGLIWRHMKTLYTHVIVRLFLVCTTTSIHKSQNLMATERRLITRTGIAGGRSLSI